MQSLAASTLALALALAAGATGCGGDETAQEEQTPVVTTDGDDGSETDPGEGTNGEDAEGEVFRVEEAGSVTLSAAGGSLRLVSADPAAGWDYRVTEEDSDEVEIDFLRDGSKVYEFEAELEDGRIEAKVERG